MGTYRLLLQATLVLALATVVNVTGSDHLAAEGQRATAFGCAACFLEPGWCEGNEDDACQIACDSSASGQCQPYGVGEVLCDTSEPGYEYVDCDGPQ